MLQVTTPWVEAVYGAVQHDLLMAVLLENMYEPGRLCPSAEPLIPVGQPLPAPGQLGALGVDRTLTPMWQVTIDVPVIEVAVESVFSLSSAPGHGRSLAQVGNLALSSNFSHCLLLGTMEYLLQCKKCRSESESFVQAYPVAHNCRLQRSCMSLHANHNE